LIDEIVRERRMLAEALEAEVDAYVAQFGASETSAAIAWSCATAITSVREQHVHTGRRAAARRAAAAVGCSAGSTLNRNGVRLGAMAAVAKLARANRQ
jgi:hypothetical protein